MSLNAMGSRWLLSLVAGGASAAGADSWSSCGVTLALSLFAELSSRGVTLALSLFAEESSRGVTLALSLFGDDSSRGVTLALLLRGGDESRAVELLLLLWGGEELALGDELLLSFASDDSSFGAGLALLFCGAKDAELLKSRGDSSFGVGFFRLSEDLCAELFCVDGVDLLAPPLTVLGLASESRALDGPDLSTSLSFSSIC